MLLNDLYYIIPSAVMAFLLSCWVFRLLHFIKSEFLASKPVKVSVITGVTLVIPVVITSYIWGGAYMLDSIGYLAGAILIYSLIFYRNSLIENRFWVVLIIKLLAALFLTIGFTTLAGADISVMSMFFASLLIVSISYGLEHLKGLDGLGGGVTVISSSVLGIWYWGAGMFEFALFSFIFSATFFGFMISRAGLKELELGKEGWRLTGFVLGYITVQFLLVGGYPLGMESGFMSGLNLVAALLCIPIAVITTQLVQSLKKGRAIKLERFLIVEHLRLLGLSGYQISFLFWLMNIAIIGVAYATLSLDVYSQFIVILMSGVLISGSTHILSTGLLVHKSEHLREVRLKKKLSMNRN